MKNIITSNIEILTNQKPKCGAIYFNIRNGSYYQLNESDSDADFKYQLNNMSSGTRWADSTSDISKVFGNFESTFQLLPKGTEVKITVD